MVFEWAQRAKTCFMIFFFFFLPKNYCFDLTYPYEELLYGDGLFLFHFILHWGNDY